MSPHLSRFLSRPLCRLREAGTTFGGEGVVTSSFSCLVSMDPPTLDIGTRSRPVTSTPVSFRRLCRWGLEFLFQRPWVGGRSGRRVEDSRGEQLTWVTLRSRSLRSIRSTPEWRSRVSSVSSCSPTPSGLLSPVCTPSRVPWKALEGCTREEKDSGGKCPLFGPRVPPLP